MSESKDLGLDPLEAACGGADDDTHSSNVGGRSIHVVQSGGSSSPSVNGQRIRGSDFDFSDFGFSMPTLWSLLK